MYKLTQMVYKYTHFHVFLIILKKSGSLTYFLASMPGCIYLICVALKDNIQKDNSFTFMVYPKRQTSILVLILDGTLRTRCACIKKNRF